MGAFVKTALASDLKVEASFDFDSRQFLGVKMYEANTIGTQSVVGPSGMQLGVRFILTNQSGRSLSDVRVDINPPEFLGKPEQKSVPILAANESREIVFFVNYPSAKVIRGRELKSEISYHVSSGDQTIDGLLPFTLKNPAFTPGALTLLGICLLLTALLILLANRFQVMRHFTTTEIVTLAVMTAFYVASSLLAQVMRAMGFPVIFLHSFWALYFFIVLLVTVRLVPKVGSVATVKLAGTLLSCLMFYGLDFINLMTYTLPAILAFEVWFLMTGYGRSLFSAVGSAILFLIFPIGFFWFYVSPIIYHSFYAMWYIMVWMVFNAVTFTSGSLIGYFFSRHLVRVLK